MKRVIESLKFPTSPEFSITLSLEFKSTMYNILLGIFHAHVFRSSVHSVIKYLSLFNRNKEAHPVLSK